MRIERIGDAVLYNARWQDVADLLQQVSHTITDPPYEAEAHTAGRRVMGKQTERRRRIEERPLDFPPMTHAERKAVSRFCVERTSGWFLAFCQIEAVLLWRACHERAGAKYKRTLVWLKPDGAPQFTGDRPGMGYETIVASWCGAGRSKWNGGGRHGVLSHAQRDGNYPKVHLAQKPVRLMRELVGLFTNRGESVLDLYMGSGTTGVACIEAGRPFFGIEEKPEQFENACERIAAAHAQGRLFG